MAIGNLYFIVAPKLWGSTILTGYPRNPRVDEFTRKLACEQGRVIVGHAPATISDFSRLAADEAVYIAREVA